MKNAKYGFRMYVANGAPYLLELNGELMTTPSLRSAEVFAFHAKKSEKFTDVRVVDLLTNFEFCSEG